MTQKELLYRRFMMLYGDKLKDAVENAVILTVIFLLPIIFLIVYAVKRGGRKKKLRDNYMKVTVEMVDLVYSVGANTYQLKMVYAHPKDNKKRYYFTEKMYRDPVMSDEAKLDYEYTMYVHPLDPKCYYVDVSNYVRNYPSFDQWIRRI